MTVADAHRYDLVVTFVATKAQFRGMDARAHKWIRAQSTKKLPFALLDTDPRPRRDAGPEGQAGRLQSSREGHAMKTDSTKREFVLVRGVRLGPRTVKQLDEVAKKYGFSRARLIRAAVANYLDFVYDCEPEFEDPKWKAGTEWTFREPDDWSEHE